MAQDEYEFTAMQRDRYGRLLGWFAGHRSVIVAFSGGVDSTLVLHAAAEALGAANVAAVTADSASLARADLQESQRLAETLGVRQHLIATKELDNERYRANDGSRCYYCKSTLYKELSELFKNARNVPALDRFADAVIVDGTNADDLNDIRPGRKAAEEAGVRHPLADLDMTKAEVRTLSRLCGLPTWNKPEMACLASRIATGVAVSRQKLSSVEQAEAVLAALGFTAHRVRYHEFAGSEAEDISQKAAVRLARIELSAEDMERASAPLVREQISRSLEALGFHFVTLDLRGYRKGGRPVDSAAAAEGNLPL